MSFYAQCWVKPTTSKLGYASGGSAGYAHRVAYEALVGPIPGGLVLDHLCRNPGCYNPTHLEPVTNAENIRRGYAVKTNCPHGHEYTAANTHYTPAGHRRCKECHRIRQHTRYWAAR